MCEKDFWNCRFVYEGLYFFTFDEVVEDIQAIKRIYQHLTDNQVYLYRWYVYAHYNLSNYQKNLLWDFLNDFCTYEYFMQQANRKK